MKIGTVMDDLSPRDALQRAIYAEKLGFESLWFSDHLIDTGGIRIDPWTIMGAIAASTEKIGMCSSVSDFQRIHPAKMAHIVATLADLSNGRVSLGIGAGEAMNLIPFGIDFAPPRIRTDQLAEAIQVVKLLFRSSSSHPVFFEGKYFKLKAAWLDIPVKKAPRIIVGALGGKSALEVAGKYGDGWVSWLNSPETFRKKLGIAQNAALKEGRNNDPFEASVWMYTVITYDQKQIEKAMNRAKRGLLAEANTLRMMGFDRPKELGLSFQNMVVSGDGGKFLEAQDSVPDELVMRCIAAGSASEIIDKIEAFEKAGATRALIHFVGDGDENQMREFGAKVLPNFSKA
ncbi:MAG: LLM class flavin-dependent oxidoreductase [Thaumarchaeota archaeon]|nr:LLM class flavin-dependent oxidoreductase [Nitrososphaerota archaeon]